MYTIKKSLEGYGSIYIDRRGCEVDYDERLQFRHLSDANYWAHALGGYVVAECE